MKKPKWYRRFYFMYIIKRKIQQIDLMGCYKFIGEWGEQVQRNYNTLITHYNKTKFWWQKSMRIQ